MANPRPFLPLDKPRSWTLFILAGLSGVAAGLLAFVAATFEVRALAVAGVVIFVTCWSVGVVSWLIFVSGLVRGRYRNLKPAPWKEQIW